MKLASLAAVAVLSLAFAGQAFAAEAPKNNTDQAAQMANDNGVNTLGIDISQAGTTPDQVKAFIATQNDDAKKGITEGCKNIVTNSANVPPAVTAFCKNAGM